MSSILLAVDPGKKHAGVALYSDDVIQACNLIREDDPLQVALGIRAWLCATMGNIYGEVDILVTEMQQIYPGITRQNPNDLLPLAYCVGAVNALITTKLRVQPLPRQWKGSTPKDIYTARLLKGLNPQEEAVFQDLKCPKAMKHNVLDAIGLAKWALTNHNA